jgi:phage FluMu protein Com
MDTPVQDVQHAVESEIRCRKCRLLLAKRTQGRIEVRWKELWLRVEGPLTIRCRRCGTFHTVP